MNERQGLDILAEAILKARFLAQKCKTGRPPRDILDEIWDLMDSVHNIPDAISHPEQWRQESLISNFDGYKRKWQTEGKMPPRPSSQNKSDAVDITVKPE